MHGPDRANLFGLAIEHQRAGQLAEAEPILRELVARDPSDGDALHLLAIVSAHLGRLAEAEQLFRRAVAVNPDAAVYQGNLARLLSRQGRWVDAIERFRGALRLAPAIAELHHDLANALKATGRPQEAIQAYREAIRLRSDFAEAHHDLGLLLRQQGRLTEAISELRQAVRLRPERAEMHINLADALRENRELEAAVQAAQRALEIRPDLAAAHLVYAHVLLDQGHLDRTIEECERVRQLDPGNVAAIVGIGVALRRKGDTKGAIDAFAKAVALQPDSIDARNNLSAALMESGWIDDAKASVGDGVTRGASTPVLGEQWELDEAIAAFERGLAIHPDAKLASGRLYTLHHHPDYSPRRLLNEHIKWDQAYASRLRQQWQPHDNDRDPGRKLRIGYVASDLGNHPIGRLLVPVFENHDRQNFELYCYCDVRQPDAVGEALHRSALAWRETRGMSDEALAGLIRQERIDILVDLTMHTLGNRMLTFARKPAPVQVTYLAYPGTTGLAAMDYRITDPHLDPPGTRNELYVEKSVRLANCLWCYPAPPEARAVGPLPALARGRIQFGCFNSFAKVTHAVLRLWFELLRRVPDSTLMLCCPSAVAKLRVARLCESEGIAASRVQLVGRVALADYFARFGEIDIALDPFPYAGGTTTCDTLWMGVPVVTLAGETGVSRAGLSILSNVGLADWIAQTPEQYVQIATDFAGDLPRLDELRRGLRDRIRSSPLMDAPSSVRSLELAYRGMWTAWTNR